MKGALLFLATIMLATPGGRLEIQEFADRTADHYTAGSPYTAVMLWISAGMALIVLMMMRRTNPARRQVLVIRWEVTGDAFDGNATPRRKRSRLAWLRRFVSLFTSPSHRCRSGGPAEESAL